MSLTLTSKVKLASGTLMPRFGIGTYESSGSEAFSSVLHALRTGYRLIDTAEWYGNEQDCGKAIKTFMQESGVPRSEIFYTTKIMTNSTEKHAKEVIDKSLKLAGLDYIDLFLIHSPYPGKKEREDTWKAMEQAKAEGKIKCLGVSNYGQRHLEELKDAKEKCEVNQIDIHPFMRRKEEVMYNQDDGIALMAWGCLARGYRFKHPALVKIADKHSKSTAQVLLRWGLQQVWYILIPKSVRNDRVEENTKIYDFELDEQDMKELSVLNEDLVTDWDPLNDSSI